MEKEIVKTFCNLVKIPSPSGSEKNVMKYIRNYLKKINVACWEDNAGKYVNGNSGNLIAKIGNGKPTVMFVAHVDTVEDGKKTIKPVMQNGIIRSDGATILGSDDKAGVTALLEALKEIRNQKNLPEVIAVFAVSEEKATMGVKHLEINPKEVDFTFDVDGSDKPGKFINKALGFANFQLHLYGKEAHAAREPEKGANAIKAAGIIVSSLRLGADKKGTMNIGRISGGRQLNIVPDYALIEGEARAYNTKDIESRLLEVKKAAKKACRLTNCKYRFAKGIQEPPFQENRDPKIILLAKKASGLAGLKFSLLTLQATLQSNVLAEKGFNALGLVKGGKWAHSKKEHISVKEIEQTKKLIVKIIEQAATEKSNAKKH